MIVILYSIILTAFLTCVLLLLTSWHRTDKWIKLLLFFVTFVLANITYIVGAEVSEGYNAVCVRGNYVRVI